MKLKQKILVLHLLFVMNGLWAQPGEEPEQIGRQWQEAPVFISVSGNLTRHHRPGAPAYKPSPGWQCGIFTDYAFRQKYPFRTGIEWQNRSFSLDSYSEGLDLKGRKFRKTITGETRMAFFQAPLLFEIKPDQQRKFQFRAGPGAGFRLWTRQKFSYRYEIPSDSLVITGNENSGSDAMDFLELNALFQLGWKLHDRWEISLEGSYKLLGFSIAKENFFTRTERTSGLIIRLFYSPCRMKDLRIF